jgi:hypothetical protein
MKLAVIDMKSPLEVNMSKPSAIFCGPGSDGTAPSSEKLRYSPVAGALKVKIRAPSVPPNIPLESIEAVLADLFP